MLVRHVPVPRSPQLEGGGWTSITSSRDVSRSLVELVSPGAIVDENAAVAIQAKWRGARFARVAAQAIMVRRMQRAVAAADSEAPGLGDSGVAAGEGGC